MRRLSTEARSAKADCLSSEGFAPKSLFVLTRVEALLSIDYLLRPAFNFNYQRLLNVPDWAKNDRHDIVASYNATNPAGPIRRDFVRQMIQRSLEERFALRAN